MKDEDTNLSIDPVLGRYIVFLSEVSNGQCNFNYTFFVESKVAPTLGLIIMNKLVSPGYCPYIGGAGCEDCPGTEIRDFRVELYTPRRGKELGLVEKLYGSEGEESKKSNYLRILLE